MRKRERKLSIHFQRIGSCPSSLKVNIVSFVSSWSSKGEKLMKSQMLCLGSFGKLQNLTGSSLKRYKKRWHVPSVPLAEEEGNVLESSEWRPYLGTFCGVTALLVCYLYTKMVDFGGMPLVPYLDWVDLCVSTRKVSCSRRLSQNTKYRLGYRIIKKQMIRKMSAPNWREKSINKMRQMEGNDKYTERIRRGALERWLSG